MAGYIPSGLAQLGAQKATALAQGVQSQVQQQAATLKSNLQNGLKDGITNAIRGAKEEIAGAINTKLSSTLFTTGAKDELTEIDIYGKRNAETINTFVDVLKGILTGPLESFRSQGLGGLLGNIDSFQNVLSQVAGGVNLSPQGMAERITNSLGGGSVINGLSQGLKSACTLGGKISPETAGTVFTVVSEFVKNTSTANVKDAMDLYNIVETITSDDRMSGIVDFGAQASIFTGVMQEAIRLNLPDSVQAMVDRSQNSEVATIALQANVANAVLCGNLTVMSTFLETLGPGKILRDVPNAVSGLVATYTADKPLGDADLADKWVEMKTVLDQLQPDWGTYSRGGESVSDLSVFTKASKDAKRLMAQDPDLQLGLMIADAYPPQNVVQSMKSKYPLAVV